MTVIAFDDGPFATTARNLDTLLEHGRSALFFVVGQRIAGREYLLERMVEEGHEVGNHSMSHRRLTELAPDEVLCEIADCGVSIAAVIGKLPTAFRPPYCATDPVIVGAAADLGYDRIFDASSVGDYELDVDELVKGCAAAGAFIGLHDGVDATVQALPRILEACA